MKNLIRFLSVVLLAFLAVAGTASAIPTWYSEFVIFSGGDLTIGGHTVINGDIGSNKNLDLQGNPLTGYPAQLNGSAYAGNNLTFGQDLTVGSSSGPLREVVANGAANIGGGATIYGDLYADVVDLDQGTAILQVSGVGGKVQYTTSYTPITGGANPSEVEGSVSSPSSLTFGTVTITPAGSFTADTDDQTCISGCTELTLTPDSYGDVQVNQSRTLNMQSGDYFLKSLTNNGTLTLKIDLSSGAPVNINVVENVSIGQNAKLWVKAPGSAANDPYVRLDNAPELAALISWNILGKFDLGGGDHGTSPYNYEAIFGGTVYSSLAGEGVKIGQAVDWYGALYALDELRLLDHSRFTYVTTSPVPEPATILLLGTGLIGMAGIGRKKFKK